MTAETDQAVDEFEWRVRTEHGDAETERDYRALLELLFGPEPGGQVGGD